MKIYLWGCGNDGRFGLGDTRAPREPTLLDICTADGNPEWIQIACGSYHSAGLTKNGEVYTWGQNNFGRLGHGDDVSRTIPTKVESLVEFFITKIIYCSSYMVVLTDKGEVLTWGLRVGCYGQSGHLAFTAKKVEALAGEVIVEVACGWKHICAVTSTGSIFTWGWSAVAGHADVEHGNILSPRLLQDLSFEGVICVSAHYSHSACVTKAGEVFSWGKCEGRSSSGKLGHGNERTQNSPKRVEALVGMKVTQVTCGESHTAVRTKDGLVYTFGSGKFGQLGHGDRETKTSPVLVQALEGKHIVQIQCSYYHTMALTSSGLVFTWGQIMNGQSDYGHLKLTSIPCLVEGLRDHNVVQISTIYCHCAVLVDPNPSPIRQSQRISFNNKEHSDIAFMVENEPLYANINVLCQKSDYFTAMFRSNMRESIERIVEVPDCPKASFLRVLEYLCLDDFSFSIDHVFEIWQLAEMYQLEGLKYACMGVLERDLCEENVSQMLQETENLICPCEGLNMICRQYLASINDEDG